MSYGDQEYRFRGEGFRDEPDFRPEPNSSPMYQSSGYADEQPRRPPGTIDGVGAGPGGGGGPASRRTVTPAELDDAFDDPRDGDPGMDRMLVHVLLEVVLLLLVAGMGFYFHQTHAAGLSGTALRDLLLFGAGLGFLTIGMGLSLRAGAVNLAVGPIAAGAAIFFATHSDQGLLSTILICVLVAIAVGVVIGLVVVVCHVPAWAASLAGAFGVVVWIQKHTGTIPVTASYHPAQHAYYWFGGFAALAVLGGILGLVKPVRRGVGRFRPVADPAVRRGGPAAAMAFVAIVSASGLAGLAGVLGALATRSVTPTDGFVNTGLALGAALVAGTSAYGRRGGVLGALLSVSLFSLIIKYGEVANLRISPFAVAGVAIAVGLMVTRLIETYGRPRSVRAAAPAAVDLTSVEPTDWDDGGPVSGVRPTSPTGSWPTPRPSGWTSQLPARSTEDTWGGAGDERWGDG